MKLFVTLIAFVCIASALPQDNPEESETVRRTFQTLEERNKFNQWRRQFKKNYNSLDDEDEAIAKYLTNKDNIDEHNKLFEEGQVTFKRAIWRHSDLSDEDKISTLMGLAIPPDYETRSLPQPADLPQYPPGPEYVNWVERGLVKTPINQGVCGSCWATSALGVIDAMLLKRNITTDVSLQQLVDCSKKFCWGCSSGWPKYALDYVKANGIAADVKYPYKGVEQICNYTTNESIGYISPKQNLTMFNKTYNVATRGNETWLRDIVASVGPVSIVMCINSTFLSYSSGVYYQEGCGMDIMHAMLIAGYGTDPVGGDYWLVKNSW